MGEMSEDVLYGMVQDSSVVSFVSFTRSPASQVSYAHFSSFSHFSVSNSISHFDKLTFLHIQEVENVHKKSFKRFRSIQFHV